MRAIVKKVFLLCILFVVFMLGYIFISYIGYRRFYIESISDKIYKIENYHDKSLHFYYGDAKHISNLDIGDTLRIGDSVYKTRKSNHITIYRQTTSGYSYYKSYLIKFSSPAIRSVPNK